jgi:hypothetical protein
MLNLNHSPNALLSLAETATDTFRLRSFEAPRSPQDVERAHGRVFHWMWFNTFPQNTA